MAEITINNERWTVVWPMGIHCVNKVLYYGMLLGRRMTGTEFGIQLKGLNIHLWTRRPLLAGGLE